MDFQAINIDAAEAALRLVGGDQLVSVVTSLYEAINKAELRGQQEGFQEGHAIGLIDGRAQVEREMFGDEDYAKVNAHIEGEMVEDMSPALAHQGDQPSDHGYDRIYEDLF